MDAITAGSVVAWGNAWLRDPGTTSADDLVTSIGPGHRLVDMTRSNDVITWPLMLSETGAQRLTLLLPRAGDPRGLDAATAALAIDAGAAIHVSGSTSYAVIPQWGQRAWHAYPSSSTPPHMQIDAADRQLRQEILAAAELLDDLSVAGGSRSVLDDADRAIHALRLPEDFDDRARRAIPTAARILLATTESLRHSGAARTSHEIELRRESLLTLQRSASEVLEAAFSH